ncbi:tetratricopeptide repeat protein [Phenylobacterium sp.]|uniref:tetratricopeptide repeat protein n=1 Tax=Phenylobacterium sp. TaxID=1871053 RepID=UPI0011F9FF97|nr:tetratricopeptide repeat protein [Phenylobacterium sp.]THD65036.1 MAG: tetratricopeptide repeat protein [Phenylobacterium sp.]
MPSAPSARVEAALAEGRALEQAGDLAGAIGAYETALGAAPDDAELLAALAGLAGRMGSHAAAAGLWAKVAALEPGRLEAVDGRARALRELGQFDEAVGLLRQALLANPGEARLWNSLGVALTQDSQAALAITFLDEAIRLDPRHATALYNRGNARFDLGELAAAAADFAAAARWAVKPSDAAMIAFARATLLLAQGDLALGWDAYEARLSPDLADPLTFEVPGARWTPEAALEGKRLLVVAEQGLGDELMFANVLPDVAAALGPQGRLSLAVEPRLVSLFQRSFPDAQVSAYATERRPAGPLRRAPSVAGPIDLWAPMGSLLRRFRRRLADFPSTSGYLMPDPARVAHWRGWLGDGAPAIGISWRSGKATGDRRRFYPPAELWVPLLATPGMRFVNLQYGDCAAELAAFRAAGATILEPPGIDLKQDIDDLAALCAALDLAVSVGNATAALAGASGAELALIGAPASWPRLGTDDYPWAPQVQVLIAPGFGAWEPVMAQATALAAGRARP